MSKFVVFLVSLLASLPSAFADVIYPYTNPVYVPTAQLAAQTLNLSATGPNTYTMTTQNLSTGVISLSGTCTALASNVKGSTSTSSTAVFSSALTLTPAEGGASITSLTAAAVGIYKFSMAGFAQIKYTVTALTGNSCVMSISGTNAPEPNLPNIATNIAGSMVNDPCASKDTVKLSAKISQAQSTTASIVTGASGKQVYVCGFSVTAVGTTPTFTFKYDTTATGCATPTAITGDYNPSATSGTVNYNPNGTAFSTPAAKDLCLTTAAASTVNGVLTYVLQ